MTGHLGNVIIRMLLKQKQEVVGLLYPGDKNLFPQIKTVLGDVCDKKTLVPLFEGHESIIVIHCAGCVSIRSDEGLKLWETNVVGTRNIVDLAMQYHVEKFIYVSSVHAIPERKDNQVMVETDKFDSRYVVGDYAKTKATATQYVLDAVEKGLPACVVHPSGIIGPYDFSGGQMMTVFQMYLKGRLPAGIKGGYDFVDVRDAAKAIINCSLKGRIGECYILSGRYYSVKELLDTLSKVSGKRKIGIYLSTELVSKIAPFAEKIFLRLHLKPSVTPYSVYTLSTNANFSAKKAKDELGLLVRPIESTLQDTVRWIKKIYN